MRFSTALALAASSLAATATPLSLPRATNSTANSTSSSNSTIDPQTPFYLVTTSSLTPAQNSSTLPAVSATSFLDATSNGTYILRQQPAGYNSIPTFTLASGVLSSNPQAGPHGVGSYVFNSSDPVVSEEFAFYAQKAGEGTLGLSGAVVTVGGDADGWRVCVGALGEKVLRWYGLEPTCEKLYLQAVATPPY